MNAWMLRLGGYFAVLDVAHDFADHVVQTDHQAAGKATEHDWEIPLAAHVGTYTATQLVVLAVHAAMSGRRPSAGRLLAAVAWSAGTHAFLDRRWPVRRSLELTGSARFARPPTVGGHEITTYAPLDLRNPITVHTPEEVVPLAGSYLADQAWHRLCLLVSAAILAGPRCPR